MTGPTTAAPGTARASDAPRDPDLILARVHLLLGSLSLARTELETIAGRGELDDDAIRDLAEARWRTGDVAGAGEAAAAWLEHHPDDILGLVIAAEAQSALGRPSEARRLAGLAMEQADGSLDPVFAGMQRSSIWPGDASSVERSGRRPVRRPPSGSGCRSPAPSHGPCRGAIGRGPGCRSSERGGAAG